MPLTPSSVKRSVDATGDEIKTFTDADSKRVQAVALVDADGNHVTLSQLADMLAALQTLSGSVADGTVNVDDVNAANLLATVVSHLVVMEAYSGWMNSEGVLYVEPYLTTAVDEASATITYVGKEQPHGYWMIMKIDTSAGTVMTYATEINNLGYYDIASAWADRAYLTYDSPRDAFDDSPSSGVPPPMD